jgi:hypothetical protein
LRPPCAKTPTEGEGIITPKASGVDPILSATLLAELSELDRREVDDGGDYGLHTHPARYG